MTAAPEAVLPVPDAAVRLLRLTTREFRNLTRTELRPPPAGAVIVGENGHGKTNLLEAAYYFMLLRSSRGARDSDMVQFGRDGFFISAELEGGSAREVSVGFEKQGKRKRVRMDGAEVPRMSSALGSLPSVMVSPRDVSLVSGSPSERRRFLDVVLAVTSRKYLHALQQYRGALSRRNAAIRSAQRSSGGGDDGRAAVWEPALAEHGAVLWEERAEWVRTHHERYAALCTAIGERGESAMRLVSSPPAALEAGDRRDALAAALAARRAHDLRRGLTSVGPHRDDLMLTLDERDLRVFGSAGQQRTASISLRLLEAETLRARIGGPPLMLLDDPFAELDARRAERILGLLGESGLGQVLLAVPREADIPEEFTRLERMLVRDGELMPRLPRAAVSGVIPMEAP
ncbi:MAG TPA: DNA replication and repair protein RecF [Gemmatimonadales bacterium]|nr:DNA replication and repair protein RecF [Gemmatimonadales bacterium]